MKTPHREPPACERIARKPSEGSYGMVEDCLDRTKSFSVFVQLFRSLRWQRKSGQLSGRVRDDEPIQRGKLLWLTFMSPT